MDDSIKKLARYTVLQNTVTDDIAKFVLTKLSRKELIAYLRFLKMLLDRKTVLVVSGIALSDKLKQQIKSRFKDNIVVFKVDEKVGAGIIAKINDTIIDLSIKGYIDEAIEKLKQ